MVPTFDGGALEFSDEEVERCRRFMVPTFDGGALEFSDEEVAQAWIHAMRHMVEQPTAFNYMQISRTPLDLSVDLIEAEHLDHVCGLTPLEAGLSSEEVKICDYCERARLDDDLTCPGCGATTFHFRPVERQLKRFT